MKIKILIVMIISLSCLYVGCAKKDIIQFNKNEDVIFKTQYPSNLDYKVGIDDNSTTNLLYNVPKEKLPNAIKC